MKSGFLAYHQDIFVTAHHLNKVEPFRCTHAKTSAFVSFASHVDEDFDKAVTTCVLNTHGSLGAASQPPYSVAAKLVYVPTHGNSGHPKFDLEIWILEDWNTWKSPSSMPVPLEIDADDYYIDSVSD